MLPKNLDYFIAQSAIGFGEEQSKESQTAIQKAIAILSSQGLYAMCLWSYGKKEYGFVAKRIINILRGKNLVAINSDRAEIVLSHLPQELENLTKIRFLENITMQILIYVKHYLKSIGE